MHCVAAKQDTYYNAFIYRIPHIKSSDTRYILIVKESSVYSQKKVVFDEGFEGSPAIDLYGNTLYIFYRAEN